MVSCSNIFVKINLKNTKVRKVNLIGIYNTDEVSESNKTPGERLIDGEVKVNHTLEKRTY